MKKKKIVVSNQEELNKHLQHTSPLTWLSLGIVSILLVGFFVWSFIFKLPIKLQGEAVVLNGEVTLKIDKTNLNKLHVNQKITISDKEWTITSFKDDGQPVFSSVDLANGTYTYTIALEKRPIEFLIGK